jgi:hypothetical protein
MWGGRPRPRRTPRSGLAKPVKRRPTWASTAVQGDRPTLDLVKKLWKQDATILEFMLGLRGALRRPVRRNASGTGVHKRGGSVTCPSFNCQRTQISIGSASFSCWFLFPQRRSLPSNPTCRLGPVIDWQQSNALETRIGACSRIAPTGRSLPLLASTWTPCLEDS